MANEKAKELINDSLNVAKEARRRQDEATKKVAEGLAKVEDEKNDVSQAAYDDCYDTLTKDYIAQADKSYTVGFKEGYRAS